MSSYQEEMEQAKASIKEISCLIRGCLCISENELHATITKMEIRGEFYDREAMAGNRTNGLLHDAEPI